jgi:hypothetical protein
MVSNKYAAAFCWYAARSWAGDDMFHSFVVVGNVMAFMVSFGDDGEVHFYLSVSKSFLSIRVFVFFHVDSLALTKMIVAVVS